MQLHSVTFSPNCRKVEAFVHQFGLDVELTQVNMEDPITKTEGFKALNPNAKVPTLVDGDWSLWESNVILTYLASSHPQTDCYPTDLRERAEVDKWLSWQSSHVGPAIGKLFNKNEDIAAAAKAELERFAPVLDAQLEGKSFVTGKLSVADFALGPYVACVPEKMFDFAQYPEIRRWHAGLLQMPGFKATDVPSPF